MARNQRKRKLPRLKLRISEVYWRNEGSLGKVAVVI